MQFDQLKRRNFIALLGGAAVTWPFAAQSQQSAPPVIGLLSGRSAVESAYLIDAFRKGLSETGYIEGQNVAIEYRWADGKVDRVPALAADLVARQMAVISTVGGSVMEAVKSISKIPVVFVFGGDPVQAGLVTSINRPDGNVTGVTSFNYSLEPKRLEIIREFAKDAVVGFVMNPKSSDRFGAERQIQVVREAARTLGMRIEILPASSAQEIDLAFRTLEKLHAGALLVSADPFFNSRREQLITLAAHYAIPALYHSREFAVAGGLMSYGNSVVDQYRQAGVYVGRLLKGEKPADLPVVSIDKFEFLINLNTAKTMGLEIPAKALTLADEVIE
jgi:putative ABC transport system substrate-binding protein